MIAAGQVSRAGQGWPTHLLGLTGPALATLVVTAVAEGGAGLADLLSRAVRWRVPLRWWLLVLATFALCGLSFAVGWWRDEPVASRELSLYSGAPASSGLVTLVLIVGYVLVVNGFGEELGWRGYLADRLLPRHGHLSTATLVWAVWALWHVPLFFVVENFRDFGAGTTVGWLVGLWFGSYFLTLLYASARCSVLIAACWHTAYNFTTATEATAGLVAAISSTLVIAAGLALLLHEVRSRRHDRLVSSDG